MKNIITYTAIVLISLIGIQSKAQSFGIKGGLNLANLHVSGADEIPGTKNHPGFHIGGIFNLPFNDILSLETGIFYTTKGMNTEYEDLTISFMSKTNLSYLEVPVSLRADLEIGTDSYLYGSVGPYFGIGLNGNVESTFSYQGESETMEEEVIWGNDVDSDLKRFDMGLTFGTGIQLKSILLSFSYDLGLTNILAYQEDGEGMRNRVFKFSVGYLISH